MPILDSAVIDQALLDDLHANVCIIGSGPAGNTIARELARSHLRVVVLESGGLQRQACADALNDIENIGRPRMPECRNRIVGGCSHTWNGRSAPFDEIDFMKRDWVPYSGWPIDLAQLTPFLNRSAPYVGLAVGSEYTKADFWRHRCENPQLDPATLLPFFWQFSMDDHNRYDYMRFGPHLTDEAKSRPNLTVITNATVTRINAVESGAAVQSVQFASVDDRRWIMPAEIVVLCAGGIENARLLLCSNNVMQCGLGNSHDTVGRFLMDHPRGQIAKFPLTDAERLMEAFGYIRACGRIFERGMRLSPRVQRDEGLLNCAAWIGETIALDDPWLSIVRFLRHKAVARDSINILTHANFLAQGAYSHFILRRGFTRKWSRVGLDAMCEQKPDPDSRVTLAERLDQYDMPLARIDWRVHEDEARTMRRIGELAIAQFRRLDLPVPVLDEWARDGGALPLSFEGVEHPTGTTRMSDDPRAGVVDADCQVHGVSGLYVAGTSVFPTVGHANPTQMIVALAVRLANYLKLHPARAVSAGQAITSVQHGLCCRGIGGRDEPQTRTA